MFASERVCMHPSTLLVQRKRNWNNILQMHDMLSRCNATKISIRGQVFRLTKHSFIIIASILLAGILQNIKTPFMLPD